MTIETSPQQNIGAIARGEGPVLETLAQMTIDTFERSGLEPRTYALVRIAALVAMDAAPASYLLNVGTAADLGVTPEGIQGTLVAVAPVVGTARIVSAASKMVRALGLAEALDDDDADDDEE
jgi:alkylhydroperoxidase/carboxymuconolactone decarboxylase family protein YurZ